MDEKVSSSGDKEENLKISLYFSKKYGNLIGDLLFYNPETSIFYMTHKKKKTWREKLNDSKDLPKVITFTESMNTGWGTGTVLVPAPIEIDEIMRTVHKGKLITINEIRKLLAKKHDVDFVCPLTTGIFAWIAAHAAMEDLQNGKKKVTPFWRTLKKGGELNPKYPGGTEE